MTTYKERLEEVRIKGRLDVQESSIASVSVGLTQHVADCAKLQKRVLVIGCVTLGWILAHSPEAGKLLKIFGVL